MNGTDDGVWIDSYLYDPVAIIPLIVRSTGWQYIQSFIEQPHS